MDSALDLITLVEKARHGDRKAMNDLARAVKPRLQKHMERLTLDEHLSQDLMQESLMTMVSEFACAYWSQKHDGSPDARSKLNLRLHAGFVDGHVETYKAADTVPLEVSETANGSHPYWRGDARWPGTFYIPNLALPASKQ